MKVHMLSSAHLADDIGIVEKETHGLSAPGHHAMLRRSLVKLEPGRIFVRLKKHYGEIFFLQANA
jgi:hypothetical protein